MALWRRHRNVGGGATVAETTTSAVVHCSSESGPVVGPIPTHTGLADAGVVTDCNPSGKCVYTSEFPGSGRCTFLDDGGCELSLVLGPVVGVSGFVATVDSDPSVQC
jgi:hypothetical protein